MKKVVYSIIAVSLLATTPSMAATTAGDKELNVSGSAMYMDPDNGDGSTSVYMIGSINWFFTDAFSLGVSLNGVWSLQDEGDDSKSTGLYLEPNYHFNTSGSLVPYIGINGGMNFSEYSGDTSNDFSYGAQGGFKSFISENVAIKVEGRYSAYESAANYGVLFGISVFF